MDLEDSLCFRCGNCWGSTEDHKARCLGYPSGRYDDGIPVHGIVLMDYRDRCEMFEEKDYWDGNLPDDPVRAIDLKEIHRIAIGYAVNDESALMDTVRDQGTLDYIASRYEDTEGSLERAAWLLWSISTMHPFMEGNKRAAVLACECALTGRGMDTQGREDILNTAIRGLAAGSEFDEAYDLLENNLVSFRDPGPLEDYVERRAERVSALLLRLSERVRIQRYRTNRLSEEVLIDLFSPRTLSKLNMITFAGHRETAYASGGRNCK